MQKFVLTSLRLVMSFIFLWTFVDKAFGFGFATKSAKAWINGGSPTASFLSHAVKGPLADIFNNLSGVAWVDWVFMLALLFIGLTFLFNRLVLWGSIVGIILMILIWLSLLFPENNPIIDEHIVYALVFALFAIQSKRGGLV